MPAQPKTDQLAKFKEAARNLGADVSEEEFDRALRKVGSAKPAPSRKPSTKKKTAPGSD